jgi:hypothetical protein
MNKNPHTLHWFAYIGEDYDVPQMFQDDYYVDDDETGTQLCSLKIVWIKFTEKKKLMEECNEFQN